MCIRDRQYAEAHTRWEAHKLQVVEANQADVEASQYSSDDTSGGDTSTSTSGTSTSTSGTSGTTDDTESGSGKPTPAAVPAAAAGGSLASDEALQALREKLTGGQ